MRALLPLRHGGDPRADAAARQRGCAPPFARALDAMERWLPDATRVTIPGTTHEMSQQDPEAFNRAVRGFLAGRG